MSSSTTNGYTRFPVVVFLLPFVLPATIVIARRGFTDTHDGAPDEESQTREQAVPDRRP